MDSLPVAPLEEVFYCQLELAIVDLRAGYLAEGSVAEIGVGCGVLWGVERVEGFKAHLQALGFSKGHLETSGHRQVQYLGPGLVQWITRRVAVNVGTGAKALVLNLWFFERLGTVSFCPGDQQRALPDAGGILAVDALASTSKAFPLAKSIRPENPQPPVTDLTNDLSLRRAGICQT